MLHDICPNRVSEFQARDLRLLQFKPHNIRNDLKTIPGVTLHHHDLNSAPSEGAKHP